MANLSSPQPRSSPLYKGYRDTHRAPPPPAVVTIRIMCLTVTHSLAPSRLLRCGGTVIGLVLPGTRSTQPCLAHSRSSIWQVIHSPTFFFLEFQLRSRTFCRLLFTPPVAQESNGASASVMKPIIISSLQKPSKDRTRYDPRCQSWRDTKTQGPSELRDRKPKEEVRWVLFINMYILLQTM